MAQCTCRICGNEFSAKRSDAKYCSEKCRTRQETIQRTEKKRKERVIPTKVCPVCSNEFKPNIRTPNTQLYCSPSCMRLQMYKNMVESGKKPEHAKKYREKYRLKVNQKDMKYHDKVKFSGNRERVLKRDNYSCQECGLFPESKVKLVVHHIDFTGNDENANNEINNLVTLCRSCHIKIHKEAGHI